MQLGPKLGVWWVVVAAIFIPFAGESAAADRLNGQQIAARWCADCHIVASGQKQGSDRVPTFAQIAGSTRFDETSLAAFLMTPHPSRMPDLSLTRSEIADLLAYIKSRER